MLSRAEAALGMGMLKCRSSRDTEGEAAVQGEGWELVEGDQHSKPGMDDGAHPLHLLLCWGQSTAVELAALEGPFQLFHPHFSSCIHISALTSTFPANLLLLYAVACNQNEAQNSDIAEKTRGALAAFDSQYFS